MSNSPTTFYVNDSVVNANSNLATLKSAVSLASDSVSLTGDSLSDFQTYSADSAVGGIAVETSFSNLSGASASDAITIAKLQDSAAISKLASLELTDVSVADVEANLPFAQPSDLSINLVDSPANLLSFTGNYTEGFLTGAESVQINSGTMSPISRPDEIIV